ncbi:hypothetical protein EV174_005507 [Coemansia sp. RSA 2320]|nr:hypothetical protein EV174_005507 [Coemansia sp. RSA 2320]
MVRVFIDLSQMLDRVSTLLDEASAAGEGGSGSEAEYLKCLERAAADFGQVWYFIEKGGDYPFVEQAGKRMRGLEQRLYTALDDFLAGRIDEFVGSAARGEAGSDAVGLIAQSLCVYGAVDGYERAEEVMRRRMVRPVVGALVASQPGKGMGMDPGAFADMLQCIADFVRRVGAPFAGGIEAHLPSVASTLEARVFWREVAATVLAGLPLLFVPGIPDRFHGNYRAACEFVRTFGGLFSAACKHRDPAVLASEESFVEFNRKWQLSAYFSIRKKQVTDGIEARDGGSEAEIDGVAGASGLCTREAGRALWGMRRIWSRGVYLEPLAARSWQLSLQIVLWYHAAASEAIQQLVRRSKEAGHGGAAPAAEGEAMMGQLLGHVHDIYALRQLSAAHVDGICAGGLVDAGARPSLQAAVGAAFAAAEGAAAGTTDFLAAAAVAGGCGGLASHVRRTTSQFRHTNREAPTAASAYVARLFDGLAALEQRMRELPSASACARPLAALRAGVCRGVSREMARVAADALATISRTEASLHRLRKAKGPPPAAGSSLPAADGLLVPAGVDLRGREPASDNDKIRRQIWLDVAETGRIAAEAPGAGVHEDYLSLALAIAALGT